MIIAFLNKYALLAYIAFVIWFIISAHINWKKGKDNFFQIEGNRLRYFENDLLKFDWDLTQVGIRTFSGRSDAKLTIYDGDRTETFDCYFMQGHKMFKDLEPFLKLKTIEF